MMRLLGSVYMKSSKGGRKNTRRGFSLVELVVVLAIIAILAAVAVVGLTGYLKRSKFSENSQDAISVYQAAQSALSQKTANGTMNDWAASLGSLGAEGEWFSTSDINAICADNATNRSVHKIIAFTYNPKTSDGTDDQALFNLLSSYFYDQSIFNGTMTVVLDVSATSDGGDPVYSAAVHSVFYSKQNSYKSSWGGPWDPEFINENGEESPWNKLPDRNSSFRHGKSFVGYFDGTEESVTGPVALPDDKKAANYDFTLRNGETLDLTWSFYDVTSHDAKLKFKLEDVDNSSANPVVLEIDETALLLNPKAGTNNFLNDPAAVTYNGTSLLPTNDVLESTDTIYEKALIYSDEAGFTIPYWITKTSVEGLAKVKVTRIVNGTEKTDYYVFPITITKVEGDLRSGLPALGYTSYTLSLDCIMTRSDYELISTKDTTHPYGNANMDKLYTIERLFNNVPKNISAYLEGTVAGAEVSASYATRAKDDPIYCTDLEYDTGYYRYFYDDTSAIAANDTSEKCVVNTLFGDLVSGDLRGTSFGTDGNTAVITSYRHLSNIRLISEDTTVNYKIVSDLDWYQKCQMDDTSPVQYFSHVKVFSSYYNSNRGQLGYTDGTRFHSPAVNGALKIVSFPALMKLPAKATLSSASIDGADPVIFSINGVQMRKGSFAKDTCYGLICDNLGTVYNIYTNNVNIVAVDLADGSDSDYSKNNRNSIGPTVAISIDVNGGTRPLENYNNNDFQRPMGGLIGWNHGTVGLQGESVDNGQNTIKMSNCIVMSSKYWSIYNNNSKAPAGGVIGRNENNVYGLLVVNGSFAVVNRDMVGGVIGLANHDVSARLVVDGTPDGRSDFTLPAESHNGGRNLSCVLASKNVAGGAIGSFSYSGKNYTYEMNAADVDFNAGVYDIDVTLPADSMIISMVGYHDEGVGGAIGTMYKIKGDSLDIRVDNSGKIITLNTSTAKSPDLHFAGGVIGFESECTIATTNITAYNHTGTEIGSCTATTGATSAGGVYGKLYYKVSTVRTFNISVINEGTITSRGEGNNDTTNRFEGTGGCIGSCTGGGTVLLNVTSTLQSGASIASYVNDAGGAIGYNGNIVQGTVTATINGSTIHGLTDSTENIGGVIGRNNKESTAALTVDISSDSTLTGYSCIGGVIGRNVKSETGAVVSVVNGTLSASGEYVGGAIGHNNAALASLTTTVNGTLSGIDYVAGVIGLNDTSGTISSSITSTVGGTISASEDYVGGAIGRNNGSLTSITTTVSGALSGNDHVAGVIGYNNKGVSGTIDTTISGTVNGTNYVAGVIGDNTSTGTVAGSITSTVSGTITGSGDYVSGVVGELNGVIHDATVTVDGTIEGSNNVGGVIGKNNVAINGTYLSNVNGSVKGDSYIGGFAGNNNYGESGSVTSNIAGSVTGTGDYVGGAIGYSTSTVNANITSIIDGNVSGADYVGGAVGRNDKIFAGVITSSINVNGSVSGASYVGGAFGCNDKADNNDINKNPSIAKILTVTVNGNITGTDCVGGAIGQNNSNVPKGITSDIYGSINGANNVGGVVGDNTYAIAGAITVTVSGPITGSADNVGGAIGRNSATNNTITSTVSAGISGNDYIGGVIGYNEASVSSSISSNLNSGTAVSGNDNVGGAIGYNSAAISGSIDAALNGTANIDANNNVGGIIGKNTGNISVPLEIELTGGSYVSGSNYVGGAIGQNVSGSANIKANISSSISGGSYVSGSSYVGGIIGLNDGGVDTYVTVEVTISSDNAVRGKNYIGTAIGCLGSTNSPTINKVSSVINTGKPIQQNSTVGSSSEAYIGGVIGQVNKGTVNLIELSGNGGAVTPSYPNRGYSSSMLIEVDGMSVGGVIGNVSSNGKVKDISVDTLGICVVSGNGSSKIGGWIGSIEGIIGNSSTSLSTYNVDTIKVVRSTSNEVGGFCGEVNGSNGKVYANININFSDAIVSGLAEVGGIFGRLNNADIYGDMIVELNNNTRLGDYYGSVNTDGTIDSTNCICIEVGGAVGYASPNAQFSGGKISVEFDSTSVIFAGGVSETGSGITFYEAGVGGAFGSIGAKNNTTNNEPEAKSSLPRIGENYDDGRSYNNKVADQGDPNRYISVISESSSPCIYSANSNVGGVIGYMYRGRIAFAYSTAVVFNAIDSEGATGGFVGKMTKGFITHCYVGGHTVGGQYVPYEFNVQGNNDVGGFVGYLDTYTYVDCCYSTASVKGNDNVGGFIGSSYCDGSIVSQGAVNTCYCTGTVTAATTTNIGAFAGYVHDVLALQNTPIPFVKEGVNNYALNTYKSTLRRVGRYRSVGLLGFVSYHTSDSACVEWGSASDINRGTYTGIPYDGYLAGSSGSVSFPYRAFVDGVHYGDWPVTPGKTTLTASNTTITINSTSPFVYNGQAIVIPQTELVVKKGNTILREGTDYYVDYVNNINAGDNTATVRISGIGGYTGMVTKTFTITPADINSADININVNDADVVYTGECVAPVISITYGSLVLTPGTDYTVTYADNLNAGMDTASVTIEGLGNYTGSVTRTFSIAPAELTDESATVNISGTYDSPEVTVMYGDVTLTEGTDYTVDSSALNDAGDSYVVTVTGANNYFGTVDGAIAVYSITYNYNYDGAAEPYSEYYFVGGTVTRPEDPQRDGYDFVDWYEDVNDDTTVFDFTAPVGRDWVIYATWEEIEQAAGDETPDPDDQNPNPDEGSQTDDQDSSGDDTSGNQPSDDSGTSEPGSGE